MRQFLLTLVMTLLANVSLSARPAAAQPVPGVWRVDPVPQAPGECRARRDGQPIDMMMLVNNDNKMILSPARPDWDNWGKDQIDIGLGIDGAPPVQVKAFALGPSYMTMLGDDLIPRVRKAHVLAWDLPTGHFEVEATGLGDAFDRLIACRKAEHAKHAGH